MRVGHWTNNLDKYEDFIGKLISVRPAFLNRKTVALVFENDRKRIKVFFGAEAGSTLKTGEVYSIGHIGKQVINIIPGI